MLFPTSRYSPIHRRGWRGPEAISDWPRSAIRRGCFWKTCALRTQAPDKALKSLWVRYGLDTPRTHSLVILMDGLEPAGLEIPPAVKAADVLTQYAVQARYPDWGEQVTEEEYTHVLKLAWRVVSWAEGVLEGGK